MIYKEGDITIRASAYHDGSTKGFRHGIQHKRHDCFRGDVRIMQKIRGVWKQISRKRKRFVCYEEALELAQGYRM